MTCVELRAGQDGTLFVFPGLGGEAEELAPLAGAMRPGWSVVAVLPFDAAEPQKVPSVGELAVTAVGLIKARQGHGPYRLLGYSFGGLLAVETAALLRAQDEDVDLVGLADVYFDQRYWPTRLFARATARRAARHLRGMARQPPRQAWSELRVRTGRLARRLADRSRPEPAGDPVAAPVDRSSANFAAMAAWGPRPVEGPVVVFTTGGADDFACDAADLWRPWVDKLEVRRLPGSHLELVRDPEAVAALARAVDGALDAVDARALRILLATTFGWETSGRLAVELASAGCVVHAVAPRGSALHRLRAVACSFRLDVVRPLASLRRAIEASDADLIVPFDDRTRQAVQQVYLHADPTTASGARLRERIGRSLGPAETYAQIYSRAAVMAMAAEVGVRCPPTAPVETLDDLLAWMDDHGGAAVLKTDGSWGGRGVAVVRGVDEAAPAWRRLSRPPAWARIGKRLVVDRDPWPLRARVGRRRPKLSVQAFVDGRAGNVAAACLDGVLLGAVQAEVVRSDGELGPSTVLRVIEHPEMLATARAMVRRLGLTGLCGFDFVLERDTDLAYLVEVNPRATPTAHLVTADGVDLLTSLRVALGRPGPPARTFDYPDGLVALFPEEMRRDPISPFLTTAYHDVPTQSPELVEHAMRRGRSHRPRVTPAGRP